jgi:hypothetical protein
MGVPTSRKRGRARARPLRHGPLEEPQWRSVSVPDLPGDPTLLGARRRPARRLRARRLLYWRAGDVAPRAEYATVAPLRLHLQAAALAHMKVLAGVRGHCERRAIPTGGACEGRLQHEHGIGTLQFVSSAVKGTLFPRSDKHRTLRPARPILARSLRMCARASAKLCARRASSSVGRAGAPRALRCQRTM